MKDIIQWVSKLLPGYASELGECFIRPKSFILSRNVFSEEAFRDSVSFLAISSTIYAVIFTITRVDIEMLWIEIFRENLFNFLSVAVVSGAMCIGWKVAGRKERFRTFFAISAYLNGVLLVCVIVGSTAYIGTVKALMPSEYHDFFVPERSILSSVTSSHKPVFGDEIILIAEDIKMMSEEERQKLQAKLSSESAKIDTLVVASIISKSIFFIATILWLSWSVISLGAYRQVLNGSKKESAIAITICFLISTPAVLFLYLASTAFIS